MKKIILENLAEIIVLSVIIICCSSCSTSYCVQNEWATPLSKQYSK